MATNVWMPNRTDDRNPTTSSQKESVPMTSAIPEIKMLACTGPLCSPTVTDAENHAMHRSTSKPSNKPPRIARPPERGVGERCNDRSFGKSRTATLEVGEERYRVDEYDTMNTSAAMPSITVFTPLPVGTTGSIQGGFFQNCGKGDSRVRSRFFGNYTTPNPLIYPMHRSQT